jgi:hypothetical protein
LLVLLTAAVLLSLLLLLLPAAVALLMLLMLLAAVAPLMLMLMLALPSALAPGSEAIFFRRAAWPGGYVCLNSDLCSFEGEASASGLTGGMISTVGSASL